MLRPRLPLMPESSPPAPRACPLRALIEVPRGSFIKRRPDGSRDFISPLPSPFNYGSALSEPSGELFASVAVEDGDPLDVLVLGPRLQRGRELEVQVWGWVDFVDAGEADPKLVATRGRRPSALDWLRVRAFFVVYARLKGALQRMRGREGMTRLRGIHRS